MFPRDGGDDDDEGWAGVWKRSREQPEGQVGGADAQRRGDRQGWGRPVCIHAASRGRPRESL